MKADYEAPTLVEVGSVRDLTLGKIGRGSEDEIFWFLDLFLS
ncbi:lasso RiPP family leader peptide-containing protein [Nocardioides sp. YIM 152588]